MYQNHSKFVYTNKDKIQGAINDGILNANDVVICEDTKEMVIILDDSTLFHVRNRIPIFTDLNSAIQNINSDSGSYAGEIIAILNEVSGKYEAYIVNLTLNNSYTVTPLSVTDNTIFDYNTLGNRPIENLYGDDPSNPIILDSLSSGIYKINGNYKISDTNETIYSSMSDNLFIISHEGNFTTIKKIGTNITNYFIDEKGVINSTEIATVQYLEENGYITQNDLDEKFEALDCITRNDAEEYIDQIIREYVESIVSESVANELDLLLEDCNETELVNLFR